MDNQLRELRAYAARRHWEVVKVYEVEASGWTGKQRRDLDAAWEDGRQGVYEVLLAWALDRLTREGVEAAIQEANRFAREGLILASYSEPHSSAGRPPFEASRIRWPLSPEYAPSVAPAAG